MNASATERSRTARPVPASVGGITRRTMAAMIALCAFAGGLWIAIRYPLARPVAPVAFVAWTAIGCRFPRAWLCIVPATLPVLGFASWSGWLLAEELDLVLLAVVAAGYARIAVLARVDDRHGSPAVPQFGSSAVVALMVVWTAFAIYRGFIAAPAPRIGDAFILGLQDYDGALNSLRVGKSVLWAALLLPLLRRELRQRPQALRLLAAGLAVGVAAAGLAIVWERSAFTDLLDFSSDYRATGLFWEMHVGGAALDGFVALTLPFALRVVFSEGTPAQRAAGAIFTLLGAYACVVSFSRGLYAGVAASVALLALLLFVRRTRTGATSASALLTGAVAIALVAVLSYVAFRHGGYRSTLAVLGISGVALFVETAAFEIDKVRYVVAIVCGAVIGAAGAWVAPMFGKGPYAAFAFAWFACAGATFAATRRTAWAVVAVACFASTFPLAAAVALYWGGAQARDDGIIVVVVLALVIVVARMTGVRVVRGGLGARFNALVALGAVGAIVVVFSAGAYMTNRFATSEQDLAERAAHWRAGLSLIRSPTEWLLGKGFGRFPQEYYFGVPDNAFPGRHKFASQPDGNRYVTLTGPNHVLGFGELYRFAQRVHTRPHDVYAIGLDVRSEAEAGLHLEVCEQHLLYNGNCAIAEVAVHPTRGGWQRIVVEARGDGLGESRWYAHRLAFFSISLTTRLHSVDVDNVSVLGRDGTELIANGSFDDGGQHWFFVSDRYHLPWHIKSLYLDVLFETGWIGVALFALALLVACHRLLVSPARRHPLAPYLAASLAGFLIVGLFDTLVDVPRVAFLFYLMLFASMFLPPPRSDAAPDPSGSPASAPGRG